jgi:hypothetical protein
MSQPFEACSSICTFRRFSLRQPQRQSTLKID